MPPNQPNASQKMEGVIERITFFSQENGYTVMRVKPTTTINASFLSRDGLVTVVGSMPQVNTGESVRLSGSWQTHPKHGKQFSADIVEQILPASTEGIKRYLSSGLVRGIGPKMAERIVDKFGEDTLDVIDETPDRLREVLDMGTKRVAQVKAAWQEQSAIREIMVFLQGHQISTSLAVKIYKHYGAEAANIVTDDPYRLARDVWGIGFKTADQIAQNLGLPADDPSRIEAGIGYTLSMLNGEGHVYAPEEMLHERAADLLGVTGQHIEAGLLRMGSNDIVQQETLQYEIKTEAGTAVREENAVYLTPFYYGEVGATGRFLQLAETSASRLQNIRSTPFNVLMQQIKLDIELSAEQADGVQRSLTNKVSVLTGGPGTGKTTCLRALIEILIKTNHSFALASPTGRAAKRLSEATGQPAQTLHRLLGFSPDGGFKQNADKPLDVDMLIIDEASMLDLLLTNNMLKALQAETHLLLVGDIDQLPSVGAGDVLGDVIRSGVAAVTNLTQIFRQAQGSLIITNAHRINKGEMPQLKTNNPQDFFLFNIEDPEEVANWVVDIAKARIPDKFGIPSDQVQVLSPMYRGAAGVANLNQRLQDALNPPGKPERRIGGTLFRVGDRIMQTRNNYDKDVFNGDIGHVVQIDGMSATLDVQFEKERVQYDWMESDELAHAYAISVHKSQGSEYQAIVLPVITQHYMMLQRNLIYTAITRAKKLCVLVGTPKALNMAVRNNKLSERYSGLETRLKGLNRGTTTGLVLGGEQDQLF